MVKLILTNQHAELFLLLNGLAVILYFTARRKSKQRAIKFGNYSTLEKVAGSDFLKSSNFVLLTRLFALSALLVAISNPVLQQEAASSKADYVIAIDSSASMLSDDLKPTRFEAAKRISSDFASGLADKTLVGVVSFSGEVKKEQELSSDREAALQSIRTIRSGEAGGTAIGDAISASTSMLIGNNRSKAIVLITDGRNNRGSSVNESLEFAKNQNTTIHAIGIGSKRENRSSYAQLNGRNASRAVFPNLNQSQLRNLARETGGSFNTVTNSSGLQSAFTEIRSSTRETELTFHFAMIAAGFLLLEWILGTTSLATLP